MEVPFGEEKFHKIIKKQEGVLKEQNQLFNIIGYCKIIFTVLSAISIYFAITNVDKTRYLILGGIEFIVLAILWGYHSKIRERIQYALGIIEINKRNLNRISGKWNTFADIGEEFVDQEHYYACDLDIVGKNSFFQFLNMTNTWHGRHLFAKDLLAPSYSKMEIMERQKAIEELSKELEFSNELEYYASKIGADYQAQKLVKELQDKTLFINNMGIKYLLLYVPILTVIVIASIMLLHIRPLYYTAMVLVILQTTVWGIGMMKVQAYLEVINHLSYRLNAYSTVIKIIKNKKFTSKKLKEIQTQLGTSEISAEQAIKNLGRIAECLNVRSNGVLYVILNALLLWDYRCAIWLQQWKQKYADTSEQWFLALGEFESLMSFANLPRVCNHVTLPTIIDTDKTIQAKEIGHPLITNEHRVNNDVDLQKKILIISGSNMSGKTTFLRTIGINLVLARCGSFVCARQMDVHPMNLITSMRVEDDLKEGISKFYAELKRIKEVIELVKRQPDTLFLIDEIFRGTNSVDRLCGAEAVITTLNKLGAVGMITTHDLELCRLAEQSQRIQNYSFSEYYREKKIFFDYKIRPGKSTTTNARYLMELVGIELDM